MRITLEASHLADTAADLLALPLTAVDRHKPRLPARIGALDRAMGGRIRSVLASGDFRGKPGETLLLYPEGGVRAVRILLVGLGEERSLDAEALRCAAGTSVTQAGIRRAAKLALAVPASRKLRAADAAQALAEGAVLSDYRFDSHRSPNVEGPGQVTALTLSLERAQDVRAARPRATRGVVLAESQNLARTLSNEPANVPRSRFSGIDPVPT